MSVNLTALRCHITPPSPTCHSQPPTPPGNLLPSLSFSHSLKPLSLSNPWSWRISPFSPTIEHPPLHRSFAVGRRSTTPASCSTSASSSSRSFPKLFLHLPHAPSKEDELELHQSLTTISKTLPVLHSSPVSSSPSPIYSPLA